MSEKKMEQQKVRVVLHNNGRLISRWDERQAVKKGLAEIFPDRAKNLRPGKSKGDHFPNDKKLLDNPDRFASFDGAKVGIKPEDFPALRNKFDLKHEHTVK